MTFAADLCAGLSLPAICAPMFLVSGPELIREACKAGLVGGIPRPNARDAAEFEGWMREVTEALKTHRDADPGRPVGPIAVSVDMRMPETEIVETFRTCARYGVNVFITAAGDPSEFIRRAHGEGAYVMHDITSIRFAEKAIRAGADGLNCIGAGGGGHSGLISHLALIPRVRSIFDGVIVMGGAVANGAGIRAAEVLGADLAYLGTRFIATLEARVAQEYKDLLVSDSSSDLLYTGDVAGVPASWMVNSIRRAGLDPFDLPKPLGHGLKYDHLPPDARPWKELWSAGQSIDLIDEILPVAELVDRLRAEYRAACAIPPFTGALL
ncbi:MAG: nitronate monooxygenase [Sphingomonadales bacterium]|nr:MAG: nitronate monooxygenase [Sphingomonadales bacterium]